MQIFMSLNEGQFNQQMLYTTDSFYAFWSILNGSPVPLDYIKFSQFFSQIQQAPGPNLRKVGKFPITIIFLHIRFNICFGCSKEPSRMFSRNILVIHT